MTVGKRDRASPLMRRKAACRLNAHRSFFMTVGITLPINGLSSVDDPASRETWGEMAYNIRNMSDTHEVETHEVELVGSFTAPDKAVVRELMDIFNHTVGGRCVLAMERLGRLDFQGLEMLVLMNDMAQAKGVTLTIRRPRGQVKEMLGLTGLDRLIPIET